MRKLRWPVIQWLRCRTAKVTRQKLTFTRKGHWNDLTGWCDWLCTRFRSLTFRNLFNSARAEPTPTRLKGKYATIEKQQPAILAEWPTEWPKWASCQTGRDTTALGGARMKHFQSLGTLTWPQTKYRTAWHRKTRYIWTELRGCTRSRRLKLLA